MIVIRTCTRLRNLKDLLLVTSCWCRLHNHSFVAILVPRGGLFNILLMILFCLVEIGRIFNGNEFADGTASFHGSFGQLALLGRVHEDGRPVLCAGPSWVRWSVESKVHVEHVLVAQFGRIKGHTNAFGVVFDVAVGGVLEILGVLRSTVPDYRVENALIATGVHVALRAPKSSHGALESGRGIGGRWKKWTDGVLSRSSALENHVVVAIVS